jgi:hypothetical protein
LSENAESDLALAHRPEPGPFLSDRSGLVVKNWPISSVNLDLVGQALFIAGLFRITA